MKNNDCINLESVCVELENSINLLRCFDEFISFEGMRENKCQEEEKIAAFIFKNRLSQYYPLLSTALDIIQNGIIAIQRITNDFQPSKTIIDSREVSKVVKIPVVTMSDYKYQEYALKDRLEHPERYEKTENVQETIAHLKKWLEEHKTEAGESVKC